MVVAFTGYRPEKMPFVESKKDEAYLKFRKRQLQVIERLIERGCTHFISGVAMGFDTWVACARRTARCRPTHKGVSASCRFYQ